MSTLKSAVAQIARNFSSSSAKSQERWARRCRLLDSSRGLINHNGIIDGNDMSEFTKKRPLPTFPLEARHFGGYDRLGSGTGNLSPNTPKEFHTRLCEMIRNAKERVRIASLYVGPATLNKDDCEETEFLEVLSKVIERNQSISEGEKEVSIRIVLDENRALRPVPVIPKDQSGNDGINHLNATTSSAEVVARAIRKGRCDEINSSSSLHLFRVLPPTTIGGKNWLPNPLDEIAGVFHIKIYIVDDQLMLSGANLSREYFRDRMDRYLHLVEGANGMVDFYADLVDILCRHSNEYSTKTVETENQEEPMPREEFLREITHHFQAPSHESFSVQSAQELFAIGDNNDEIENGNKTIVAVGIPTFQAPAGYFRHNNHAEATPSPVTFAIDMARAWSTFWSLWFINRQPADEVDFVTDVDATLNLLKEGCDSNSNRDTSSNRRYSARLSSAYLNPTSGLLSVLQGGYNKIELLSAGKMSHGFKPKKKGNKEGSQGKDWTIPSIFDELVNDCISSLRSTGMDARLLFWERPGWTFHAKGIWLTEELDSPDGLNEENVCHDGEREVAAVVVGSSNFGYRSFYRDMESNLLLVFPPGGDVAPSFEQEWKNLTAFSKQKVAKEDVTSGSEEKGTAEKPPQLPWPILKSIPYIKTYF
eukprot:CAMPEP_0197194108 /NCGR_PEP_ID=MMETSP1423-20130617/28674_1 /TAXON_ID=476441 /ORGANISM="Pseudo-nitzschia heimii, Strain UNC1101" /LENGTH=648 /DNA_ID=CAMNT_0042647479 /DNA_START=43 /DNA_END=1989 /DNA_ORIENTATION=-